MRDKGEAVINVVLGVAIACAVAVTGLLILRESREPQASTVGRLEPIDTPDWEMYAAKGQHIGSASESPRVTIVEFGDYQCTYCRGLNQLLREISDRYPDEVAIVYRHFPVAQLHPFAASAALAAECAGAQGSFPEMHHALYDEQHQIGTRSWLDFAAAAGVADLAAFSTCIDEGSFAYRLNEDREAAALLQLVGAPAIIVNSKRILGAPSRDHLSALIHDALVEDRATVRE
jgi:protein-disulfide isomerase